jgi:hypothetical protein
MMKGAATMRRFVLPFLAAGLVVTPIYGQTSSTYDAVVRGMVCKQSTLPSVPQQLDCQYRVGRDLEFAVTGVGQRDAAITIVRAAGYGGDYYASIGLLHGCIIVKPGTRSASSVEAGMAFVSPKTGKVYKTWEECGRVT